MTKGTGGEYSTLSGRGHRKVCSEMSPIHLRWVITSNPILPW